MKTTYLYFFEAGDRIKIGISRNVRRRLKDVSHHMETEPKLIDAIPGSYDLERFVHLRLNEHRLKGEWFKDCAAVRGAIDALLRDGPDGIGYKETPRQAAAPHIARDRTPEEMADLWLNLAVLIWPGDPAESLAEETDIPAETWREYLSGTREIPRAVGLAFASLVTLRALSKDQQTVTA